MTPQCDRETEVLDLVWTNQWPARADDGLRRHAAECHVCRDLAAVAEAVGALNDATLADAHVPDAGLVWYRAQVRARQELTRRAARPVVAAQAAAVLLGGVGVLAAWRAGGAAALDWWSQHSAPALPQTAVWSELAGVTASPLWGWLLGGAAAWALMVPLALYVARIADRVHEPSQDRT
jgi:hypothetical protein